MIIHSARGCRTEDGELTEHDLRIGRTGLRINGEAARAVQLEVKPEDLEDLEVTLGSGASSVVRKVRHRPTGLVLAMKVRPTSPHFCPPAT